jgi:hypothetical protein
MVWNDTLRSGHWEHERYEGEKGMPAKNLDRVDFVILLFGVTGRGCHCSIDLNLLFLSRTPHFGCHLSLGLVLTPISFNLCLAGPNLGELTFTQIPQLVDRRRLARHDTFRNLDRAGEDVLVTDGILSGLGLDLDQADPWILWTTCDRKKNDQQNSLWPNICVLYLPSCFPSPRSPNHAFSAGE